MKNILKIFLSALVVFSFNSCEDSNKVVDQVVAGTKTGAVLRTIEVLSNTLNADVPTTFFSVEVEEQDEEDGALLLSVDVFVSIRDLTPDNGTTVAEALVKTIDASAFSTGPDGLPRAIITATFGEAEAAMGIDRTMHSAGDLFVFELRLNLTDGRTFGASDAAGIITGGFFSSPYAYNTLLLCSPEPGDYTIDMYDSFGDGWQTDTSNSGIKLTVDGTVTEIGMCDSWDAENGDLSFPSCTQNPDQGPWYYTNSGDNNLNFKSATVVVNIPNGAQSATWDFPGDAWGEIAFDVYGPQGQLLLSVGTGDGAAGLLPITLCKL